MKAASKRKLPSLAQQNRANHLLWLLEERENAILEAQNIQRKVDDLEIKVSIAKMMFVLNSDDETPSKVL
jgi:hypothetical protein